MNGVTREIWWNVPAWLTGALYLGSAVTLGYSVALGWRHLRSWLRGRDAGGRLDLKAALPDLWSEVFGHRKLFRDRRAAVAHLLVFYGFLALFVGTCLVFVHDKLVPFLFGPTYLIFSLVLDLAGLAYLAGLGLALHRRYVAREARLEPSLDWGLVLATLAAVGITGFALEGARIAVTMPAFEVWSPVGYGLAAALRLLTADPAVWERAHRVLWGLHAATVFVFFALLVVTPLRHMFAGPANIFLRHARPLGALVPAPGMAARALKPADLTWRQLLDASACVRCGRCTAVCPATAAGKPLDPRRVVQAVLAAMQEDGPLHARIPPEEAWSCTTCAACVWECPFDIEVLDKLVALRREDVESGAVDRTVADPLEAIDERGNPWREPASARLEWARGLQARVLRSGEACEVLYWVGCAGAFDPQGQAVARSVVGLLRQAGVDYGLIGLAERCTGDPARRMGEEGLFARCAARNVQVLAQYRFERLLVHCPHCLQVFRHEYGPFGGAYAVVHHSQLLAGLVATGRLKARLEPGEPITFHDPCYLARYNGEVEAPRDVLKALPGARLVEMGRARDRTFCCGAGGGGNWVEVRGGTRIAAVRMAEAEGTGAATVATACPFCRIMLEGETASRGSRVRVRDIAELLLEAQ